MLSNQRTGEQVQSQVSVDTASVLIMILSLSWILNLTWPDYSVFFFFFFFWCFLFFLNFPSAEMEILSQLYTEALFW